MTFEQRAARIAAMPVAERPRALLDAFEFGLSSGQAAHLLLVGLVLRNTGDLVWAEYALNMCLADPGLRAPALYELAVLEAMRHNTGKSLALYAQLRDESQLSAYQNRTMAGQLLIAGRFDEARVCLETSIALEPGSTAECWAVAQLIRYCQTFPSEQAIARARAVRDRFEYREPREVAEDARSALREGRSYAMVRMNDGEGSLLSLSLEDNAAFSELYAVHRRYYCGVWFGDAGLAFSADVSAMSQDMHRAFRVADCIGAEHASSVQWEYSIASMRIPLYFNIVRKFEQVDKAARSAPLRITHPMVNHSLMAEGHLEAILAEQKVVGLVSSHAALPKSLTDKFGFEQVHFHKTGGEVSTWESEEPEPFSVWHPRVMESLKTAHSGVLYLVAAGPMAKVYCELIKQAGGVALDIGSVADVWMKKRTRHFNAQFDGLSLVDEGWSDSAAGPH